jgi:predicted aspartyl protease
MKRIFALALFLSFSVVNYAQNTKIDTIPFTLKSSLLVFKGKLNGVATDFALDTGASLGVVPTAKANAANIRISGKKSITDSNENQNTMQSAVIETVTIGTFEIKDIKSIIYDMPFLACTDVYLLGANAINNLNWKIDFDKKLLYVSKTVFEPTTEMLTIPIVYKSNRHFTTITIQGNVLKNCLIDTGYNDFLEVPTNELVLKKLKKDPTNDIISSSRISMSLSEMKINAFETLSFDNLILGNKRFDNVKIDSRPEIEKKIGIKFFSQLTSVTIMNNSTSTYHLQLSNKPISLQLSFDADVFLQNSKLIITGKSNHPESTAKEVLLGDEIRAVNGLQANDFKNECDLFYGIKELQMTQWNYY